MRIKMKRTVCIFLSLVLVMGLSTMMLTTDDHKFTVSKGHFLLYNIVKLKQTRFLSFCLPDISKKLDLRKTKWFRDGHNSLE